jgi:hypothetical protein
VSCDNAFPYIRATATDVPADLRRSAEGSGDAGSRFGDPIAYALILQQFSNHAALWAAVRRDLSRG